MAKCEALLNIHRIGVTIMNNAKLFETILKVRNEAKRRVRAFAANSGNKKLIAEVEKCLQVNEARAIAGLSEEAYEFLSIYEDMYDKMKMLARLSK